MRLRSVLSLAKLAGGLDAGRYYTDAVARGREDYYAGAGEAKGRWAGVGSGWLALSGEVEEGDFGQLMRGLGPRDGRPLRQSQGPGDTAGFDVTFSAPKSVSVLYGVGDEETVAAVREAHDVAVGQALGYLEREAAYTRRGKAGRLRVKADGLVIATFRHRTSRAGDPQLHTHAVVANTARADGRWSALDARGLYRQQKTAGYLYKAALRYELSRSLGVSWGPVEKGSAEITGVPTGVLEHFSRRRREIVEYLAEEGRCSPAAAEIAALETRKRKDYAVPVDRMRERWRARAAEHGLSARALGRVRDRPWRERIPIDLHLAAPTVAGVTGVTREHASFDRRDAIRAWCEQHAQGATVERIEELTDRWLASRYTVKLSDDDGLRGARYSTPQMLRAETELLTDARERTTTAVAVADASAVDAALAERPELTSEQQYLVRALTTAGDGVHVVRAPAGTGKTYALEAAHAAWKHSGLRTQGCALSARAARELQEQTAIPSQTIHQLRADISQYVDTPPDVLIVDEAGMVGTRDLHALSSHAREHRIKLVLVGDDRQLPEIEAGGAYHALARQQGALQLSEVKRQREAWDREAVTQLRDGDRDAWATAYREHDRIVSEPTAGRLRARLVADWWQTSKDGSDTVMIAHRRADVADLNQRARRRMRDQGRLGPVEIHTPQRSFAQGDQVICRRNERQFDLVNGTRGEVTALDAPTGRLTITDPNGHEHNVDRRYLDAGHLDHAYATTAHALQGATVDHALVLGSEDLYQQWGYTALSRHRHSARFYLHADAQDIRPLPGLERDYDPAAEHLNNLLSRGRGKALALDERVGPNDRHPAPRTESELTAAREAEQRAQRPRRELPQSDLGP